MRRRLFTVYGLPFTIFCLLLTPSFTTDDYKLVSSITCHDARFTTDRLGNSYVIVDNQLLQYDTLGRPIANYQDLNAGNLGAVDVRNPFKIFLFYPDFALIEVLDNKLSLQSLVQLRNIEIMQPLAACQSMQGGYWVYDYQDTQLKKITFDLKIEHQSGNLNQILGYSLSPNFINETDNSVYLNNPETGILVFDRYGTYFKTIPYTGLKSFQIIGNEVLFVKENRLLKYNLKTLQESEILLPQHDSLENARIEQQKLFLLTKGALSLYSY